MLSVCISLPAQAESYYSGAQLKRLLLGKRITLTTGARIQYKRHGRYIFSGKKRKAKGMYRFTNTHVCVRFANGRQRCDRYVKDGASIYLQNGRGGRYKVLFIY